MKSIELWRHFWTACFILSVSSFAFIAAVVLLRGARDLKEMLRELGRRRDS